MSRSALGIHRSYKPVQRLAATGGNVHQSRPELLLQRDTGAMAGQREVVLDQTAVHRDVRRRAVCRTIRYVSIAIRSSRNSINQIFDIPNLLVAAKCLTWLVRPRQIDPAPCPPLWDPEA